MAFTATTFPLFYLTLRNYEVTVVTRKSKPTRHTVDAHVITSLLADDVNKKKPAIYVYYSSHMYIIAHI